ncbi:type II toxin-antitoxin system Phd/YefM family antitoxin [Cerasibacillus quisquiliarum]|uniref:type II toxin-antitoxin system Phd/YefM family antitoxin n=1 Tax=Cerasibacillus quisquiliarum TaxID=227865 RepID=UPI00288902A5|nr:type II toxin-antitoxin system Phd/YefM family antitoxin [Cerasibacillus quisquiliarum]
MIQLIKSSSDLRHKYREILDLCSEYDKSVYITKNGHKDLAVMSIETYEKLAKRINTLADMPLRSALVTDNRLVHKGIRK